MRPISVRFQCFGPYMAEQHVDFELLREKGIFLINGETGAGKTTILDAMCYALYGESSGGSRGEMEAMRCKNAGKGDVTFVEFVFEISGKRYRFYRELRMARKNLTDSYEYGMWQEGTWIPLDTNHTKTNMNAMAERLIGLTSKQFRQVIILPQGKFEELLVSDSKAKEAILSTLFHTEQWELLVKHLRDKVNNEKNRLEQEKTSMTGSLKPHECTTLEEFAERIAEEARTIPDLQEAEQLALTGKTEADKRYERAIAENKDYEELANRKKTLDVLAAKAGLMAESAHRLAQADGAERIREQYKAFLTAEDSLRKAAEQYKRAKEEHAYAQNAEQEAKCDQALHEAARGIYEDDKKNVTLMENVRGTYSDIEAKKRKARELRDAFDKANQTAQNALKQFQYADVQWRAADLRKSEMLERSNRLHARYRANIYGILASELETGKPCPVCGSIHHTAPASVADGEKVTDRMLDDADKNFRKASDEEKAGRESRTRLEQYRENAATDAAAAETNAKAAAAEYHAAAAQLLPGIANIGALDQKISELTKKIAQFETAEKKIAAALQETGQALAAKQQAFTAANEDVLQKKAEWVHAGENWRNALASEGFEDQMVYLTAVMETKDRDALRESLAKYKTDCERARRAYAEQQEKIRGTEQPDLKRLEQLKSAAEKAWKDTSDALLSCTRDIEEKRKLYAKLSDQWNRYQQDRSALDANTDFLRKLDPSSGLSLQRYVLGIMLASITTAANELLKSVHGGRYQLRRSDTSTSGNKTGLELNVFDSSNGECRSVKTLSGGEKFLVALSLAIGLSTVVQTQSGGTKLEAMFIDEGFGSLDGESINDALDVLNGIRKGHGLVGIISHVDKLAGTIPTRIEVRKGRNGNDIHPVF